MSNIFLGKEVFVVGETVYDRVKALCEKQGVTVAQMERDIGFHRGNACKWKNTVPSVPALNKLSAYLGAPVAYILKGEQTEIPPFDVKLELTKLAFLLRNSANVEYSGDTLDDFSRKIIIDNIEQSIRLCDIYQDA